MTGADAPAAGRLIALGLQPRAMPGRDSEYADLIVRHQSDGPFAELVSGVAEGQGLKVLGVDRITGLVLAPASDGESPYRLRISDYVALPSTEHRLLHGLIHLTIAATCYPTAAAVEDEAAPLPSVTAREIQERLERLARALADRFGPSDPPSDQPELEPLWRLVLRTRATDTTTDGRSTPHTILGMIRKAFKFLEEQGLADKVDRPEEPDTYRVRGRYRLHVLDAAREALVVSRGILNEGCAPHPSSATVDQE